MSLIKISAYTLYICVTIFGSVVFAAEPLTAPKLPMLQKGQPPSTIKLPGKEKLILINKDLKKSLEALRPDGPRTGGGGNSCAMAITRNTQKLQEFLNSENNRLLQGEELSRLQEAMDSASFFTADSLELNGQKKEAINYPHLNKIVLSESFCKYEMADVSARAMSLLLHEYLGLARIDDRKYQISGRFLESYSELSSSENLAYIHLQNEVKKDMAGQQSCFQGTLKFFAQEMQDMYGGRYASNFSLSLAEAGATRYRAPAKYCQEDEKTGNRICNTTNTQEYLATVTMSASTSGSIETEVRVFVVTQLRSTRLVVKEGADYFPEDNEIISRQEKTEWFCSEVKTPSRR